ncbi:MAG: Uncharacterized protein XD58_1145 [Thermotoga sp. 50_1627]|uniref:hypothetical protein n=1 Tax=Pseudothermotoga sp. TaxID=2033661 RepID=UPI00076C481A|nr:MAG: Uncharacterized protein XD45_1267 [Thermotoga sp. 50_64]KUK24839.1 MAG: Uncharacterized protein XD58_1145 [Thermotoga sp. 50_1627]MBC7116931.1 hypothetical protein [Pseudothermotoga sp.]MDK2924017.1 hypothetical protein [Pseudothermotoga sp.]HBT39764.1 hypothetical protein [Pseudothermotoga sp.]
MRKFLFVFLILSTVLSFPTSLLFELAEQFAGVRDFIVNFDLTAEIKQDGVRSFYMSGMLVVRNLEDFYFLVKKPDFVSNLSFAYFSRIKRLVFGTESFQDFENLEIPISTIVQAIQSALRMLQTPLVSVRSEGDYVILTFSRLVAQQLREPIKVKLEIKEAQLRSIEILSPSEEEKIRVKINSLVLNAKTDEYFQLRR